LLSGEDHDDSDDNEITDHYRKRNWGWARDECFVCHQRGPRNLRSSNGESALSKNKAKTYCKTLNGLRRCSYPHCSVVFHDRCFLTFSEGIIEFKILNNKIILRDFLPDMHVLDGNGEPCFDPECEGKRWICPQHECNACHQELLRTRSQLGAVISCVECIFAWHRSCVPIGCHHVNRFIDKCVLCPRHVDMEKATKFNMPYCVVCDQKLDGERIKCDSCIRSFCAQCWAKDSKKKKIRNSRCGNEHKFVCGYCICVDHPRIGDYVLALAGRKLYPAKTLHADKIPSSLLQKSDLINKLEEPGYVLIRWVEGLAVPNYAVISFKHLVPMPKSFSCFFWKSFRKLENIYSAVEQLYQKGEVKFGLDRPLPPEALMVKIPPYKRIDSNINGKAALTKIDSADICFCIPENGVRCNNEKCPNRASATECPKDCDELFLKPLLRRDKNKIVCGKCTNNFLRKYQRLKEEELMEERITSKKGFGVFAKKDILKGTDLAEYLGVVIPKDDYLAKLKLRASHHNLEMSYFGIQLTSQYYLDGRNFGGMARTMNHSCDPNCQVAAITVDGICRLKITTIRDITKNEEITFDYDSEVQEGLVSTRCYCGSLNCRGFIGKKGASNLRRVAEQYSNCQKRVREETAEDDKENLLNDKVIK
uniref:Histone-lysine N-methyltransferase n=1 Tax=Syphacia muris TaxID=451379 RepID=A0A0N5AZZ0_9BILA